MWLYFDTGRTVSLSSFLAAYWRGSVCFSFLFLKFWPTFLALTSKTPETSPECLSHDAMLVSCVNEPLPRLCSGPVEHPREAVPINHRF